MGKARQKYLIVVGGPTASGKTGLAIQIAQHFSTVILSADSRQFYQEMEVGNARPDKEELAAVQHYFVADRSLHNPLSAGAFAREALALLNRLYEEHDTVVLVGGSGLFIRALTEGLDEFPPIGAIIRMQVDELFNTGGLAALQDAVKDADPDYYAEVDQKNPARLKRAFEVYLQTGKPFSSFRQADRHARPFIPIYLQPDWPRELLYQRINKRVEIMLAEGLEGEARALAPHRQLAALQTVGYQEWWDYFTGEQSHARTVELIQQNSRRYAKRQLTWNRRDGYWKRIPQGDLRAALAYIHLQRTSDLALSSFPVGQVPTILHHREEKKRFGLIGRQQQKISGVVDLVVWKETVFIRSWFDTELDHNGRTILLHEACHRSEAAQVFTVTRQEREHQLLKTLGWQVLAAENEHPPILLEKYPTGQIWIWRRQDQEF